MRGRIIKGVGGLYTIDTEKGLYTGNARGIFRLDNIKPLIGDYVEIEVNHEEDRECSVDVIYPRKNMLVRPSVSNVDQVYIVFSIKNPNINVDLLDRFIVLAESKGLEIIICINKVDIGKESKIQEIKDVYGKLYKLIFISTYEEQGLDEMLALSKGKVSVFAGPSGVGKSSILNKILPNANMEIGEISKKIKRGKHTTRHVELHKMDEESYLIDSPGFTSLFFEDIEAEDLQDYFIEFEQYKENCKYRDCMHKDEVECGVKAEVGKNISENRYKRYLQFLDELRDKQIKY